MTTRPYHGTMTQRSPGRTSVECGQSELLDLHAIRAQLARQENATLRDVPLGRVLRKLIDFYRSATEGTTAS